MNKYLLFAFLLFVASCEKDPKIDGNAPGDNLEVVDSLSFTSFTTEIEPQDALNEGDVALGRLVDSRFGESLASFYAELTLSITSFETGNNPVLDSAVLVLAIEDYFGPFTNPIDFEVYRLTEEISSDNEYTTDLNLSVDAAPIGGMTAYTFSGGDSLRIPLTSAFGNELLGLFGSTTTSSNDLFQAYLNGLYITVSPTSGGDGLFDLDLTSESTGLELYFSSDDPEDSLYTFNIGTTANRLNRYQHNYAGSLLEMQLNDNTNDDEVLYLGGLQLSKGIVELPDMSFLQGAIINQAKLTFYQADYGDPINTGYDNPDFLLLTGGIDLTDTVQYFLSDYSSSDPTAYGGTPELTDVNGNPTLSISYTIPRFIQRFVNGETDITFLSVEVVNYNNGNRMVLGGGSHPDFPITLEILYTKP